MLFLSCFASILLLASRISHVDLQYFHKEEENNSNGSPLNSPAISEPHCNKPTDRSLLFVSTADGKITCLDALNGDLLWSRPTSQSLISSSISLVKSIKDLKESRLVPSLNGNLFKWTGDRLETVPLSGEYLLGEIKKLPDGSFVVGGQEVSIHGIDVDSGEVSYECTLTGCRPIENNAEDIKNKDILSIRRTQKTIRVMEPRTGREKWNFSVGNLELELIEGENNEITLGCESDDKSIRFSMHEGLVTSDKNDVWSFKFTSPIAGAWKLDDNKLKVLNVFSSEIIDIVEQENVSKETVMYLGIYNGQMYVQNLPKEHNEINTFSNEFSQKKKFSYPQIGHWRPLISTSPSRTPFLNTEISTSLSSLDYPFDNGFFLYSNITALALPIDHQSEDTCSSENPEVCTNDKAHETAEEESFLDYDSVPITIIDWWKEIFALSIIIAVGINVLARLVKRRLVPGEVVRHLEELSPLIVEAVEEAIEEFPEKISTSRLKINSVSIATSPVEEIASDEAGSSTSTLTSTSEYTSRYMVDFEHLECLGKGGFGVVFKAKKKIDDCEYAIKRICLPRCDDAKARMMREVKALAALEHSGIVRYFHAWWEEPPKGWQLETDRQFLMKGLADTPSYALSDDWRVEMDTSPIDKMTNNNKKNNEREPSPRDDPLGRRYNFDTELQDYIGDNSDLLRHNDVFYSDDSLGAVSSNGDSFITFENIDDDGDRDSNNDFNLDNSGLCLNNSDCSGLCLDNLDCSHGYIPKHRRLDTLKANDQTEDGILMREIKNPAMDEMNPNGDINDVTCDTSYASTDQRKRERRVVGKCCNRNSTCLKEPPLFLYIQMQLCKHQTLKEWLMERKASICFMTSFDIFMQIVNAVKYFHCQGMMHRDLKPANIFFSLDGSIKVGDFGLVTAITRPSGGKRKGGFFQDENHTGQVGTHMYMSPEQAGGKAYSQKVDLYALGLILFELISYFSTQMERMQLLYGIKRGVLPDNVAETPQGRFVKLLTSEEPSCRPEAKEIAEHQLVIEMCENFKHS